MVDLFVPRARKIYDNGVNLHSAKFTRYIAEAKTTNYIEGIKQTKTFKGDVFESLYYSDKQVFESSNSNIFVVKNKKIFTPKNNVYKGVLRDVIVFDFKNKLHVQEKDFNLDFLLVADEVFITGAGKGVVPVVKVDNVKIGNGKVGNTTRLIMRFFDDYLNNYCFG